MKIKGPVGRELKKNKKRRGELVKGTNNPLGNQVKEKRGRNPKGSQKIQQKAHDQYPGVTSDITN